jgi:hypothetical protein
MKKQEILLLHTMALMTEIEKAIKKYKKLSIDLAGSDNPQQIELCSRAEAKQEAFEAVLLAMRGNGACLNIEAN